MRIGILADIHGNATALEAVLNDCKKKKIESLILLGDLYSKGPSPQQVCELLSEFNIIEAVRGNTELWFLEYEKTEKQKLLTEYGLRKFSGIKNEIMKMHDKMILKVNENTSIAFLHSLDEYEEIETKEMFTQNKVNIIISAHTHIPQDICKNGIRYLNPGSVGMPYDNNPAAGYAILSIGSEHDFIIRRIAYPVEKEIEKAEKEKLPYIKDYTKVIQKGVMVKKVV